VAEAPESPPFPARHGRPIFYNALRITLGRTPLWMFTAALTALLALVAAGPWFAWFESVLAHRYMPGSVIRALDENFLTDVRVERAAVDSATRSMGAVLALLAMLAGAFTAGGWLQVFLERTHGHSLRRFVYGGSRYYFRFLRVLGLTLLLLHGAGWLVYGRPWEWLVQEVWFGLPGGRLEGLDSELVARRIVFAQDGLYVALFAAILVWGTYTRTRLALHDTSSSVWAGLCSTALLFAHPIRTLRPMLSLFLAQAAVLWLAAVFSELFAAQLGLAGDGLPILFLFLVTALSLFWRAMVRGASYHAACQVSAQLVRPIARPDPWKKSLGGPGGPRYPIGDDEYGVAL
jgi:hypothetical protein